MSLQKKDSFSKCGLLRLLLGAPGSHLHPCKKIAHTRDKNPRQRSLDAMTTTAKFFLTHILEGKIKMRDDYGCGYPNLRG